MRKQKAHQRQPFVLMEIFNSKAFCEGKKVSKFFVYKNLTKCYNQRPMGLNLFISSSSEPLLRVLTLGEVLEHIPYTKAHVYRLLKSGNFPKPFPLLLTGQLVWKSKDIETWLDQLAYKKEAAPTSRRGGSKQRLNEERLSPARRRLE